MACGGVVGSGSAAVGLTISYESADADRDAAELRQGIKRTLWKLLVRNKERVFGQFDSWSLSICGLGGSGCSSNAFNNASAVPSQKAGQKRVKGQKETNGLTVICDGLHPMAEKRMQLSSLVFRGLSSAQTRPRQTDGLTSA